MCELLLRDPQLADVRTADTNFTKGIGFFIRVHINVDSRKVGTGQGVCVEEVVICRFVVTGVVLVFLRWFLLTTHIGKCVFLTKKEKKKLTFCWKGGGGMGGERGFFLL